MNINKLVLDSIKKKKATTEKIVVVTEQTASEQNQSAGESRGGGTYSSEGNPTRLYDLIKKKKSITEFIIFERDNFTCQRCGVKSKNVQCAHFIGRRNKTTRWLETNATTLCMGCHGYFHANPLIFVEWTKKRLGEKEFDFLLAQERIITKPDKRAIEIYLRAKLAEITA